MSRIRSLHWLAVQPTPYNDHLFRAIASQSGLELTVHYCRKTFTSHPWKSRLASGYRSRVHRFGAQVDPRLLRLAATDSSSYFVVAGWGDLTKCAVLTLLARRRRPFAIWTDTPDLSQRPWPMRWIRPTWLSWLFRRAHRVMGTGRPGTKALEAMGCPAEKLVNFPFFVDLGALAPPAEDKTGGGDEPVRLVSAGRLDVTHKGWDLALRALGRLTADEFVPAFEYWIAGTGPDEEELRRLTVEMGLQGRVHFLGWTEPDDLVDLYHRADALVHPARYDPFPVTVLEAMAAGLPVLGSRAAGSIRDRVEDGVSGFTHESGSVDELTECLRSFLTVGSRKRREMGGAARQRAEAWPVDRGVNVVRGLLREA